ncbi:MAG: universal stress protein [Halieaceae bacterium]|jgi:universal stress protein A
MPYQNILVAVDLGATTETVIERAAALARDHHAQLHVLHVIEPLTITYGGDIPMDFSAIQEEILDQAKQQLNKLCENLGVAEANRHLVTGRPESEIPSQAKAINGDLIVVGTHARWGLALLLGSTTDGVMHSAECDVLAVKVDVDTADA